MDKYINFQVANLILKLAMQWIPIDILSLIQFAIVNANIIKKQIRRRWDNNKDKIADFSVDTMTEI